MSMLRNLLVAVFFSIATTAQAEPLKPFVLGDTLSGDLAAVAAQVKTKLQAAGFQVVGSYNPYPHAVVIAATNAELREAATRTREQNGGFGVVQRVAVTAVDGAVEVSYSNPTYIGVAYGLGKLPKTTEALKKALGAKFEYGAAGIEEPRLKPGEYRYSIGMPYFTHVDVLAEHADYKTAIDTVERNLAAKQGGTAKVYRVDLPDEVSVLGVAIVSGDGADGGAKDTDREIMDIIDFQRPRSTAYLPYELMVKGREVIALRARYRIAVNFPDLKMFGKNSFGKIMSAPDGIKAALTTVATPASATVAGGVR